MVDMVCNSYINFPKNSEDVEKFASTIFSA